MARPVVALLSDFGTQDHYAGTMKGVVLSICPEATLVDITHGVQPHDLLGGALELAAAFRYFPQGTVFLVVVDPGVGSARHAIAAETGDYRFVGPDNGVLTLALKEAPPKRVVEVTERRYARPTVSRTFEGRDRFAPAAAWLAKGIELSALGRPLTQYVQLTVPEASLSGGRIEGTVLRVDRFGNLVTNIDRRVFEHLLGASMQIAVEGRPVGRLVSTYSEGNAGEICALFGSADHLEIAANGASAAEGLGLGRGAAVTVARAADVGAADVRSHDGIPVVSRNGSTSRRTNSDHD